MLLKDVISAQRNRIILAQEDHLSGEAALSSHQNVVVTSRTELRIALHHREFSPVAIHYGELGKIDLS